MSAAYVLEGIDALSALLDVSANDFRNELGSELAERAALRFTLHDVHHPLSDLPDLRGAGVRGLLDLVRSPLGKSNGEKSQQIIVRSFDHHVRFDQRLPFADERAELVGGEVKAVEVGQTILALYLVDSQLDFAESMVFIFLQVGKRNLENAAFERVVRILETSCAVDESLADTASRGLTSVPVRISFARRVAQRLHQWATYSRILKVEGAFTENQSFLVNGSVFFFNPFLPFDSLLFFPTAILAKR